MGGQNRAGLPNWMNLAGPVIGSAFEAADLTFGNIGQAARGEDTHVGAEAPALRALARALCQSLVCQRRTGPRRASRTCRNTCHRATCNGCASAPTRIGDKTSGGDQGRGCQIARRTWRTRWAVEPWGCFVDLARFGGPLFAWCLGRESNPYGLRRGIFFTLRLSPPAAAVRALDYAFTMAPCAVGAPRLVSTPSPCEAWLGVASTIAARGFTEFEGIHAGAFASRCSIFKSLVSTNFTTQAAKPCILPESAQRVKCA